MHFSLGARARGVVAWIPGFKPGSPGSIPGQGIKISLQATTHCCLSEINLTQHGLISNLQSLHFQNNHSQNADCFNYPHGLRRPLTRKKEITLKYPLGLSA